MFILTINGRETEGAYSVVDDEGEQILYLFEEEDDATRYALMLEDQEEKEDNNQDKKDQEEKNIYLYDSDEDAKKNNNTVIISDYYDNLKDSQRIKVKIDYYDVWSMDNTLAHIIVPMLEKLQEMKHGAPCVDNKDVPKHLHSPENFDWSEDTDVNFFKRWDYVMDEMIWTFTFIRDNDVLMIDDEKERERTQKRIENGTRLFGKYYQSLWD